MPGNLEKSGQMPAFYPNIAIPNKGCKPSWASACGSQRLRVMRGAVPQLTSQPGHVPAWERTFAVRDIAQNVGEPARRNRLVDIAERARAHGIDRAVLIRLGRDEHDLHVWSLTREDARNLVTSALGHMDVEQRKVGLGFEDPIECSGSARRLAADVKAGRLQLRSEDEQYQAMVVCDDDRRPSRLRHNHSSTIAALAAHVKKPPV
jgi:hypothetical protein